MNEQKAIVLLKKYEDGTISPEEKIRLETWYLQEAADSSNQLSNKELDESFNYLKKQLPVKSVKQRVLWPLVAAAASLFLVIGMGLYFNRLYDPIQNAGVQDVAAGGNKAFLTLADGKRITLTDAANGQLARQAGVEIRKSADGQLVYTVAEQKEADQITPVYNTIETPKGGQYQVSLPDGTKVWLNAASSLRFPAFFTGLKERRVELSGEAYFEVAHNMKQPFIVKTTKQEVTVLGTHFNISSYRDEETTKTTLLQGAVLIHRQGNIPDPKEGKDFAVLKPGEECLLNQTIKTGPADTEMATAWKDGNFQFNDLDLQSVMRQLSRWYNVDVDYSNVPKGRIFTAFISRSVNLSEVLKMLEVAGGIQFKIENKTIKIMNLKKQPM